MVYIFYLLIDLIISILDVGMIFIIMDLMFYNMDLLILI